MGIDAQADPGGPSSPEALLIRTLLHDLVMGRMAQGVPRVLHDLVMGGLSRAGSQHYITHFIKWSKQLKLNYASKEYWSGLPFAFPGDLPDPGITPVSPALQADSLPLRPPGKPQLYIHIHIHYFLYSFPL